MKREGECTAETYFSHKLPRKIKQNRAREPLWLKMMLQFKCKKKERGEKNEPNLKPI